MAASTSQSNRKARRKRRLKPKPRPRIAATVIPSTFIDHVMQFLDGAAVRLFLFFYRQVSPSEIRSSTANNIIWISRSISEMAKALGTSEKTIATALKRLESHRLIQIVKAHGRTPGRYGLLAPRAPLNEKIAFPVPETAAEHEQRRRDVICAAIQQSLQELREKAANSNYIAPAINYDLSGLTTQLVAALGLTPEAIAQTNIGLERPSDLVSLPQRFDRASQATTQSIADIPRVEPSTAVEQAAVAVPVQEDLHVTGSPACAKKPSRAVTLASTQSSLVPSNTAVVVSGANTIERHQDGANLVRGVIQDLLRVLLIQISRAAKVG